MADSVGDEAQTAYYGQQCSVYKEGDFTTCVVLDFALIFREHQLDPRPRGYRI